MADELEDFLNTSEAPEAETNEATAPETAEADTTEVREARARDEKGRFAPKGETQEGSPASEEPQFDHAATIGERRRRQEAEARIAALEAQIAQFQQPQAQAQPPAEPPEVFDDGYTQWVVEQAVGQAVQAAEAKAAHTYQLERIRNSAAQVRSQTPDYEEKVNVFYHMAGSNPALWNEMNQSPNPAEYAYNIGKMQLAISQHGGIQGYINAQVAAAQAQPKPQAPIPDTLADQQSSRGSSAALTVPTLDQILGR